MKIVADENIPLIKEKLGSIAEVVLMPGRRIERNDLLDADVLLVRSVTRVDKALLEGTAVRYVGTATSGTDHICEPDMEDLGIRFAAAPGCNARAVVEYVVALLAASGREFEALQFGVVGCGQVGGRLYQLLKSLGCQTKCYDPFLILDDIADLTTLDEVMSSDVVSVHTPLTRTGQYPTFGMLSSAELDLLPEGAMLINAGRGGVIDENSLKAFSKRRRDVDIALDVWEREPVVDDSISRICRYITPHIAGYSELAKKRGAETVLGPIVGTVEQDISSNAEVSRQIEALSWQDAVLSVFDPVFATEQTREVVEDKLGFDQLRKGFGNRLEFSQVSVQTSGESASIVGKLGFAAL